MNELIRDETQDNRINSQVRQFDNGILEQIRWFNVTLFSFTIYEQGNCQKDCKMYYNKTDRIFYGLTVVTDL